MGPPIAYLRRGDGPPLVLVHGALMDRDAWNAVSPFLRDRLTLHAIDRRGRGGDAAPFSVEREVEDIAAVLKSIGEPYDLVGQWYDLGEQFLRACLVRAESYVGIRGRQGNSRRLDEVRPARAQVP